MKTNLFIAALSLAVLAGCSSEDEVGPSVAKSDNAINFGTYVGKQTKADVMNDKQLQSTGFQVIATYTGEKDWATAGTGIAPNFMYDQAVTYSGGWTYSPTRYWPNEQNESGTLGKVTFFAYSPKKEKVTTLSAQSKTGLPTINLVVADNINQQIDLIADMITDLDKSTTKIDEAIVTAGTVKFKLDHLLSQIKFQAKLNAQYAETTQITVTGIKLAFKENTIKNEGTYTFNTDNSQSAIWTLGANTYHKNAIERTDLSLELDNSATPTATGLLSPMFLLPQTYTAGDLTAVISYTVTTDTSDVNNVKKIDLPVVAGGWVPNKQYLYTFDIELTNVTVDVKSADWGEETNAK
ncbi:hypothetical protein [uncultured Parabacteroides sp.]|uniref:hypothetical protein n=1 Tax=uncultured Parabacteroides sp. TaxID=512312 RepID=UPI0026254042|nr:hypothetical protein [uncultured Parabacteroides sp.]